MATARQRSRYFWGLHPVCTLGGLPILFALTGSKADARETLRETIIGDKNYYGRDLPHSRQSHQARKVRAGHAVPSAPGRVAGQVLSAFRSSSL
jgi:hypothetical protein